MNKKIKYILWGAILLLPALFRMLFEVLGLIALGGYLLYYTPISFLGEPFFIPNSDLGFLPSWKGILITAIIYSGVYWTSLWLFKICKDKYKTSPKAAL
ncbi:hypothetical protein [Desulfuromonas sp. AOP6]|uniref:hypothetical protein n=1 Tax=Desulfuromonas sp. AOP6 TaxID=1566351 RepID=UPI0012DD86AA|nr:hypothetical protein [Desulfuromonas sp. AOP6]